MEAQPGAPSSVPGGVSGCALSWEATPPWHRIRPRMAQAGLGGRRAPPGEPVAALEAAAVPAGAAADPDVALMLRVQEGDQAAFQELFRKFAPRVLQYARRFVGSEAQAEELAQDVFVQVFRFRHRYKPQSRLSTWMFTIATNLCLNELRRPEQKRRVDIWDTRREPGGGRPPAGPPGPPTGPPSRPRRAPRAVSSRAASRRRSTSSPRSSAPRFSCRASTGSRTATSPRRSGAARVR